MSWTFRLVWMLLLGLAPLAATENPRAPEWIWSDTPTLERSFDADRISAATLRSAADFCTATIELNGIPVLTVEPFSPTVQLDVTPAIVKGPNRLVVRARQPCGPAAVALSLTLSHADGRRSLIVTDGDWRIVANEHANQQGSVEVRGPVEPELWGIGVRSAQIEPYENYEQWRIASGGTATTDPATFWTGSGFEIQLLRRAAENEGSWISLVFDPQGRLIVSREDRGLYRMTLNSTRDQIGQVELINDQLLECRGLVYVDHTLYATANNSKGLYRLRDTHGDDKLDDVQLLREFPGGVGHGRNDLAWGQDERLYLIHGDSVRVPKDQVLDRTSPFREARRGEETSEGFLLRTDPDARNWELLCAGLRNPYGVAQHPSGDWFTYDADAEFDMGTPWYRPTRVVQLLSGADYGWRGVTGKWPPYFVDHPDNAPPTLDIGKGSPTAVAFAPKGTWPEPYDRALFILDWAYGRILAVHLAPRGAGYRAEAETFLQGRPLNLTDLTFGPDGAMYLVTGGRKTQSALYRVSWRGAAARVRPASVQAQACEQHAREARRVREDLEQFHGRTDPAAVDAAWPYLDHADPIVRHAARIAIEHQPLASWKTRALDETRITASLTALTALARSRDAAAAPLILDRLLQWPVDELTLEQTLQVLHLYTMVSGQVPEAWKSSRSRVLAHIDVLRTAASRPTHHVCSVGSSTQLRRELARISLDLEIPSAVDSTIRQLLRSPLQEDQMYALLVLRHARQGWTPELRREYFTALAEVPRYLGGEGMPKFFTHLREDSLASLDEHQRPDMAKLLDQVTASMSDPAEVTHRPLVKNWAVEDFAHVLSNAERRGDSTRGANVFRDAQCARCHRVGARGPAVGPDLSFVGRRFSRRDILESILLPSQVVAENYRNVQVTTKDGRVLMGRVLVEGDYRSQKLRLAPDPLRPADFVEIHKSEIDEYQLSLASPMPSGLVDRFEIDEILDLLAYLEAGGAP